MNQEWTIRGNTSARLVVVGVSLLMLVVMPSLSLAQPNPATGPVLRQTPPPLPSLTEQQRTAQEAEQRTLQNLLARSVRIDDPAFTGIVQRALAGVRLSANSCGNVNEYPHKVTLSLPNLAAIEQPLDRLEYGLTPDEKNTTEGAFWSGIPYIAAVEGTLRTRRIRACVEHWEALEWGGSVAQEHLLVGFRLETAQLTSTAPNSFPRTTPLIKTRRMIEYKYSSVANVPGVSLLGWMDLWDWNNVGADITIRDYHNGVTSVLIELQPALEDGRLTYGVVKVNWLSPEGAFMSSHTPTAFYPAGDFGLFQQVPSLQQRILQYNSSKRESFTQFVAAAFDGSVVKARLSDALNTYVTSSAPAGARLTDILWSGSSLRVLYSQP